MGKQISNETNQQKQQQDETPAIPAQTPAQAETPAIPAQTPTPPKQLSKAEQYAEDKEVAEMREFLRQELNKPKKSFKLPRFIRSRVGKKRYLNHALILYLRRNREVEVKFEPILNDMIRIGDKFHDARADCYYTYGKKRIPTLVIPEYNLRPIGTADYQEAMEKGEVTDAQDILIKAHERMEMSQRKMQIKPGVLILIVLGAIGAIYMMAGK